MLAVEALAISTIRLSGGSGILNCPFLPSGGNGGAGHSRGSSTGEMVHTITVPVPSSPPRAGDGGSGDFNLPSFMIIMVVVGVVLNLPPFHHGGGGGVVVVVIVMVVVIHNDLPSLHHDGGSGSNLPFL